MRVSIVATALDGQVANTNGVVNMVNRIQNRNSGYSEGLFSTKGSIIPNNSLNTSIGATALKLDEHFEADEELQSSLSIQEANKNVKEETIVQSNKEEQFLDTFENNYFPEKKNIDSLSDESLFEVDSIEQISSNGDPILSSEEESTPKLFSDEVNSSVNNTSLNEPDQKLFSQENDQEEDFEIPAFLRRQKF
jgi:cell division protein FtsZ